MQRFYHYAQELVAEHPVQDAVVERKGQVSHGSDSDCIAAIRVACHHNPFLDRAYSQDRALGLVDDRSSQQRAGDAVVRNRKSAAPDFVRF